MHIAGYMAALDIDDLDHMAKVAVEKIAGRANQHTAAATVSVARIATDMGVIYETGRRALARAVKAGYLTVDKPPGRTPRWQLTSRVGMGVTPIPNVDDPHTKRGGPPYQRATKDSLDTNKDYAAGARARTGASAGSGEKPARAKPVLHISGSGFLQDWTHNGADET